MRVSGIPLTGLGIETFPLPGVTVAGTFHCRKSEGNSRELEVEFQYRINHPGNLGNEGDSPIIVQSFKVC